MTIDYNEQIVKLVEELENDEGRRTRAYKDSKGILSIGIGRNLEAKGLSDAEINMLLLNDIKDAVEDLQAIAPWWQEKLDTGPRQRALINMSFNLGRGRLAGFKKMFAALEAQDWDKAAEEALDSKWRTDVGDRALRIADMIKDG